jgi:uncharacterized protein YndB with AHSA1/START domain
MSNNDTTRPSPDAAEPVRVERAFSVPAARVFDAWLDPVIVKRWLFRSSTNAIADAEISAKVGGKFSIVEHANREVIDDFGEYLEIERPRRLAFTLEVPKHFSGITRVAIHISPTPNGCALELTQTGVRPEVTAGPWRTMLETLAKVLDEL